MKLPFEVSRNIFWLCLTLFDVSINEEVLITSLELFNFTVPDVALICKIITILLMRLLEWAALDRREEKILHLSPSNLVKDQFRSLLLRRSSYIVDAEVVAIVPVNVHIVAVSAAHNKTDQAQ